MKAIGLIQLFLFVTSLPLTFANQVDCPAWFIPDADNGTECVCSTLGTDKAVKCSKDAALLKIGLCMTYNNETKDTEIGPCPFLFQPSNFSTNDLYFRLPKHTSNLNSFMCGSLHRQGLLCGECEDGFGPAIYSYTLECKKCWENGAGWLLYITLTVIPTTVLYIIVVVFHVSATSPPIHTFVFFCQTVVGIFRTQPDLYLLTSNGMKGFSHGFLKVILALCGLWNLDFFRSIIPPFCVSPNMTNLPAFALEYIEAFYPLILILITYICIKLHDHNFRPVVLLWKPFHRCFAYSRRSWDSEASVINVFATFLLLSFSKILFVSFTLLYGIQPKVLNGNGTILSSPLVMYYDPTAKYFTADQLPFAFVSICILLVFIVLPTLLLILYPTRIFRKCITCCRFRRWHALHTFMEAFQGQYKDGTNGTRDFRMVSALYLVFRFVGLLTYVVHPQSFERAYGWVFGVVLAVSTLLFVAIARPYKVYHSNTVDCLLLALLSTQTLMGLLVKYLPNETYSHIYGVSALLTMSIPHAALVLYILYIISEKIRILEHLKRKCQCLLNIIYWNKRSLPEDNSDRNGLDTDSLPDRLVNPNEYEPLMPAVNQPGTDSDSYAAQARVTPMNTYGIVGNQ